MSMHSCNMIFDTHWYQYTYVICFHREQVQLRSRLSAHCLCLGLCLAVCLLTTGPLGELWTGALWHGLLYRLAPVQSASHSTLLHCGALHLLLHPPLLHNCGILHGHSSHSARIPQDYGAACIAAEAHEQHPDNNCQGKSKVKLTWITLEMPPSCQIPFDSSVDF